MFTATTVATLLRAARPPLRRALSGRSDTGARHRTTSSSGGGGGGKPKPSRWDQLAAMAKEHGPVFVVYYSGMYALNFGAVWSAITYGGLDGLALLNKLGVDRAIDTSGWSPRWVNPLLAMAIADLCEPLRLPLVLATTPRLGRLLRQCRR